MEFVSLEGWRRQFDVNLFWRNGADPALLPLLRRGVATHGLHVPRVVIVSSIGGRIAQPVDAPYTCSKFAVSALGDCLRLELRRQGIGVTVLEPGAIATAIWGKGQSSSKEFGPEHPAHRLYGPELDGLAKLATTPPPGRCHPIAPPPRSPACSMPAEHRQEFCWAAMPRSWHFSNNTCPRGFSTPFCCAPTVLANSLSMPRSIHKRCPIH